MHKYQIDDIIHLLKHRRYESARILLDCLIANIKVAPEVTDPTQFELEHENGNCWCGAYHEVKIT